MSYVLTLIAPAPTDSLAQRADAIRSALPGAGEIVWLAPDEACDIPLPEATADALPALHEKVGALMGDAATDWAILPAEGRRKRMLIADMDSTIIEQECLDEIADVIGIKPQIAEITERAMRGELQFESALRERVGLLVGLQESALAEVLARNITLTPGARVLLGTMRKHGAYTVLVSGGFTFFTSAVARRAGFHANRGNKLLFENGLLTGVAEPILGREAKIEALRSEAADQGITPEEVIAVGDGANDLGMLKLAGLGVAYHAKPIVAAEADARVDHANLTALLYLQGYHREEFATYEAPEEASAHARA